MACNREGALRAKSLAEEKMKAGDFVGAHKFVAKAQRLFADLENMQQMITICDVHSSANNKICGLHNWYGILQVQPFTDVKTIEKQFRRLALLIHPDKNKFAGAEAAFKLIKEAKSVLSDNKKRSEYDVSYKYHSLLASRQSNANSGRHGATVKNADFEEEDADFDEEENADYEEEEDADFEGEKEEDADSEEKEEKEEEDVDSEEKEEEEEVEVIEISDSEEEEVVETSNSEENIYKDVKKEEETCESSGGVGLKVRKRRTYRTRVVNGIPEFTITIRKSHLTLLNLPKEFVEDHIPDKSKMFFFGVRMGRVH